jgi:hypothetical protein
MTAEGLNTPTMNQQLAQGRLPFKRRRVAALAGLVDDRDEDRRLLVGEMLHADLHRIFAALGRCASRLEHDLLLGPAEQRRQQRRTFSAPVPGITSGSVIRASSLSL